MGRTASVSYSGPGSNGVNKYFVYDSAVLNSQTMQHTTNRMAEAYTSTSNNGTKITDLGFSYNARGDKTDVYEMTPNSGGYYHTTVSYYSSGATNTLSGIPGEPSWTFGVDAMGRPTSITETANCASSCRTVLSSVNYSLGRVTGINYGSGDSDTFDYSAATGQETDYNLYVGANNTHPRLTSNLSWFPTGQLQQQQFVDTINPGDNQTCTYGYDPLNRLSNTSCGTVWSQTFSYDQFGNLAKSGSISFAATYNSKNQIATLGSTVPTYDASGNLLTINTGVLHTYTWDAENRIASIDGKNLVYDAIDRVVEEGSSLQILYGPTGKLGTMSGQTAQRVYISLPKGAQLIYDASNAASPIAVHPDLMGNGAIGSDFNRGELFSRFFAPFGEVYENSGSEVADFTGQYQDLDANLYDYQFREQSPVQGRWLNPDPSGMAAVSFGDPQTLNRYAYVRGSAMGMTDPNGLQSWGQALRSFLNGAFGNVQGPPNVDFIIPGCFACSYSALTFSVGGQDNAGASSNAGTAAGTATVTISETVTLPDGTTKTNDYGATAEEFGGSVKRAKGLVDTFDHWFVFGREAALLKQETQSDTAILEIVSKRLWGVNGDITTSPPLFIEIEQLEENNLLYDAGRAIGKIMPEVNNLPGVDKFGDQIFNYYGEQRDANNRRIDQLLQTIAAGLQD